MNKRLNELRKIAYTLYHGTVIDNKESIEDSGLEPQVGGWVEQVFSGYSEELFDDDNYDDHGLVFAADKSRLGMAVGAMLFHISKKLNDKDWKDITDEDIVNHGMLVIIKDGEDNFEYRPKWGEEGHEDWHWRQEEIKYETGNPLWAVEPGDWFSVEGSHTDIILTGKKLLAYLRRHGEWPLGNIGTHGFRKHLIENYMKKSKRPEQLALFPKSTEELLEEARSMTDDELLDFKAKHLPKGVFSNIDISDRLKEIYKIAMPLSDIEKEQLGKQAPGSQYNYFTQEEWDIMREKLVNKRPSRSYKETDEFKYDPELTAFTPGETLDLLSNPKILDWFKKIKNYKIPEEFKHIILVPCAASKPWGASCPGSGKYYRAYNEIRKELGEQGKKAFWLTISEPLGIVPEDMWDSFPGYDVPGLFKNRSQQMSGTETREYKEMFGDTRIPPFDNQAYKDSIKILGDVIGGFIMNNVAPDRRWISFVDKAVGATKKSNVLTTHTEMINDAINFMKEKGVEDFDHTAYPKSDGSKGHARKDEIRRYLSSILEEELSPKEEGEIEQVED